MRKGSPNTARPPKNRLQELRAAAKMRQEDVADQIGIGLSGYRKYEQGTSIPTDKAQALARLFGVTVDYLLSPLSKDGAGDQIIARESENVSVRTDAEVLDRVQFLVKQLLDLDPAHRKLVVDLVAHVSKR